MNLKSCLPIYNNILVFLIVNILNYFFIFFKEKINKNSNLLRKPEQEPLTYYLGIIFIVLLLIIIIAIVVVLIVRIFIR